MTSSTANTATGSRSSSPHTPDSSDSLDPISIHRDYDLSSWLRTDDCVKALSPQSPWDSGSPVAVCGQDEEHMLRLDDLIERHAYDDSPSTDFSSYASPVKPASVTPTVPPAFRSSTMLMSSLNGSINSTKPIPPPASRPRKRDPATANQKVVCPPKESCCNLPIMVPSIPEGGTKSRVETQVRVTVDLADSISPDSDPYKYDRVGSWKWLKLPPGTATKRRTRKQGKIDADPQDTLHLIASVSCATAPHNRVLSCSSCQAREAKRVAKKLAARVRPARSDSDSFEDPTKSHVKSKQYQEDTTSIIQFNCAEVLDFSSGTVILPLRITCYCRHHREKVGFNVHFTMMDHNGRVVGTGTSRPIMITDDHKTTSGPRNADSSHTYNGGMEIEWAQAAPAPEADANANLKRKQGSASLKDVGASQTKRRAKPYDSARIRTSEKVSRETSVSSLPSPSGSHSTLPVTRPPTPPLTPPQPHASDIINVPIFQEPTSTVISPTDTLISPSQLNGLFSESDILMSSSQQELQLSDSILEELTRPTPHVSTHIHSDQQQLTTPLPFLFFPPGLIPPAEPQSLPPPTIHRLIPSSGPTHGGIEVTILGANFHPSLQLNCVFGDAVASSTQRWSDNTLVCVLPARDRAGVVGVWFEGGKDGMSGGMGVDGTPTLFTYSDESDRALMELALQVVGLKMTGKIEDAKNVAMRIVGNAGESSDTHNAGNSNMMQIASITARVENRHLLLLQSGNSTDFEALMVGFLRLLDLDDPSSSSALSTPEVISHQTSSGQTLLHLAVFMGLPGVVQFLVQREIDTDVRDRNGWTALHFAALVGGEKGRECARILLAAGADAEIVNAFGKTPDEIAQGGLFEGLIAQSGSNYLGSEGDLSYTEDEDEEAIWGDGEDDAEDYDVSVSRRKFVARRSLRQIKTVSSTDNAVLQEDSRLIVSPAPPTSAAASEKSGLIPSAADEKQAASFIDVIQRTLAQLHAPQGIIPNMPQLQLPLPNLPQLPPIGMPAVPWGALPQIPMVFPVFVPMPAWPSFLGGDHTVVAEDANAASGEAVHDTKGMGASAIKAAHEWRATWEKWLAAATAKQTEDVPPPMYTPRADGEGESVPLHSPLELSEASAVATTSAPPTVPSELRPGARRFDYEEVAVTEQEVNAFVYQPPAKIQKWQKKNDRMLLLFWLPILLISLLWGFHNGVQFMFKALKDALPLKNGLRT